MHKKIFPLVIVLLAGCGSVTKNVNIDESYTLDKTSPNGLIIGSVSQSPSNGAYLSIQSYFYLYTHTNKLVAVLNTESENLAVDWGKTVLINTMLLPISFLAAAVGGSSPLAVVVREYDKNIFGTEYGFIFAMELPAGEYAFNYWLVKGSKMAPDNIPSRTFSVQAGKTTYIGNLHMNLGALKESHIGPNRYVVDDCNPIFRDQNLRDLALFRNTYKKFAQETIDIHLLPQGPWGIKPEQVGVNNQ